MPGCRCAVGLYLIAWGIFTTYMFVASLRTTAAVALVFFLLAVTFFLLGIGNSGAQTDIVKAGGWFGLATAAAAWYASLRRGTNSTFGRTFFWWGRTWSGSWSALLEVERFEPAAEFRERALWSDPKVYEEAAADPEAWWMRQATELLDWDVEPSQGLDDSNPPFYKWFEDGRLNASANCLDRHVEAGRGDRVAYHWRGEEGEERDVTYAELHRDVQRFANALKDLGVGKGDVVGIYLPMIPEVVVAMLACARIGAPHNVVFGGFSAEAVRERMEFSEAKALVTVDGARRKGKTAPIKPQVDEQMGGLKTLETIVVVRHTGIDCPMQEGRDVFYDEAMAAAEPECPAEPMEAEHPLYILYTSGSTAKPKGILHTTGGYMTGVTATHKYVFDLKPESDVYWCAADVGWVTGHSYIVYGPLTNGATSVMWEGAPDYPTRASGGS